MTDYLSAGMHRDIPEIVYHSDPCETPSLSASIARLLIRRTPAHAWVAHPRLNPEHEAEDRTLFDLGTAVHTMLLGGRKIRIIDHKDYKTKAAKEARDQAYADNQTPLLKHQYEQVSKVADAAKKRIKAHPEIEIRGTAESTILWQEDGVWCRVRPDFITSPKIGVIYDLKLTKVAPVSWDRHAFDMGYDITAGLYLRGARKVLDAEYTYVFVNIERDPPYGVYATTFDNEALEIAEQKTEEAISIWRECLKTGNWPAWPDKLAYASPPAWEAARWEERRWHKSQQQSAEHIGKTLNTLEKLGGNEYQN